MWKGVPPKCGGGSSTQVEEGPISKYEPSWRFRLALIVQPDPIIGISTIITNMNNSIITTNTTTPDIRQLPVGGIGLRTDPASGAVSGEGCGRRKID